MKRRPRLMASRQIVGSISTLLVLLSSLLATGADAKQVSGTLTIDSGEYYGWEMDIMIPSQIEVEITGRNASLVDVLVLNEGNYSKYVDGAEFEFYEEYSALSVSNISLNFTVLSGTVYVIVDNSDRPAASGAANPADKVQIDYWLGSTFDLHAIPDQGNTWLMYVLVVVAGFGLVMVVVLTRRAIKGKRKARDSKEVT